jgi:hypothetical protein
MLLLLCLGAFASSLSQLSNGAATSSIVHLYPEESRDFQKHICGDVQLYHVHDLDPHKVYDLKISYPASLPTTFTVDVQEVLLAPIITTANGGVVRKVPRRMLNTEKLRLFPHELLRKWRPHLPLDGVAGEAQQRRDERFRFDELPGAHTEMGDPDADLLPTIQQGEFIVEISVRGDVQGVSPVLDVAQRVCVYNIVVEEMLLEAFPRDTLVLIAWLVMLLALVLRVVLPFVMSLVALEHVEDREITELLSVPEPHHTKTS